MRLPLSDPDSDGPNLVPMIDVVFNLLIFFLVATRFDQEERQLPIALPEVTQAQPMTMKQGLVVNISNEGKYQVVGKQCTEDEVAGLIREFAKNNPHERVMIRGDGRSALKYTARVASLCYQAKIECKLATVEE